MSRNIKEIPVKLTAVKADYAKFLGKGFDTVEETFNLSAKKETLEELERAKERAKGLDLRQASRDLVRFAGVDFQIYPYGGKGYLYFIETNDYKISIGNPECSWAVSVHYFSCGLWTRGYTALRAEVDKVFAAMMNLPQTPEYCRLRRVDIAFDIYSEKFTKEMRPAFSRNVVAVSGVKKMTNIKMPVISENEDICEIAAGVRLETLTIGTKSRLQIQIYNKTREVVDKSGKTWIFDVWRQAEPDLDFKTDVWRVEFRFFGKFLRERNIDTMEDFQLVEADIMEEALMTRRLCKINKNDTNRARWALHPIWSIIYRLKGAGHILPIGRVVSDARRFELVENLKKQLAGGLRSAVVLTRGEFDDGKIGLVLMDAVYLLRSDKKHEKKVERILKKYRFVDEAS